MKRLYDNTGLINNKDSKKLYKEIDDFAVNVLKRYGKKFDTYDIEHLFTRSIFFQAALYRLQQRATKK